MYINLVWVIELVIVTWWDMWHCGYMLVTTYIICSPHNTSKGSSEDVVGCWQTWVKIHCIVFKYKYKYYKISKCKHNCKYFGQGPLVKCGITEFRRGILDVHLTHEKNFPAVIIGYISIRCYDVWWHRCKMGSAYNNA